MNFWRLGFSVFMGYCVWVGYDTSPKGAITALTVMISMIYYKKIIEED